jgi:hypothetical protein
VPPELSVVLSVVLPPAPPTTVAVLVVTAEESARRVDSPQLAATPRAGPTKNSQCGGTRLEAAGARTVSGLAAHIPQPRVNNPDIR